MANKSIEISVSDFEKREIEIDFEFDWDVLEEVKGITGRQFDDNEEVWHVKLNERNLVEFLSFCQKYNLKIEKDEVKSLVQKVKDKAQEKHNKYKENKKLATKKEADLDKVYGLKRGMNLYEFQRVAVEYIEKNKKVLIGDEMGLGKTIQALGAMEHLESYPALIVCPASLKQNWKNEAEDWLPSKRSINIIDASDDDPTFRRRVIIINYALLRKYKDTLLEKDWEMIIADESHFLKNEDAQRTQNFKEIAEDIPYLLLLSGTPITNRPSELISQLKILDVFEDEFGGWWEYCNKFCDLEKTQWGMDISGASNLEELHEKLLSTCYIRRNKEDVLDQLPEKNRQVMKFGINNRDEYRKVENNIVQYFRDKALEDEEFKEKIEGLPEFQKDKLKKERASKAMSKAIGAEHLVKLSELRKITIKGKLKQVTSWVDNFLKSEEKLVLFAHHTAVCNAIEEKYECLKITGEVPSEDRQEIVEKFQDDPDEQLIILNIAAGGVGITLTAASHVGFIELPWSPAAVEQGEDRCVLEGQPVLTPNGWKSIENINVGDSVIGHDGKPHKITDVWSRKARGAYAKDNKNIVEIDVLGWQDMIKVTSDHRILTEDGWKEAENLSPRDKIKMPSSYENNRLNSIEVPESCKINTEYETPKHKLFGNYYNDTRTKPKTTQKNSRLISLPDKIELTNEALFVFGYYIGDGFCYTGNEKGRFVSFSGHQNQKKTHLSRCHDWVSQFGINASILDDKESNGTEIRVYSGELANWFQNNFGRILKDKKVPEWIYECNIEQRKAFIEGWIASDGYQRRNRKEIITTKKTLAAEASRLLMSIGMKPCIHFGEASNSYTIGWTEGVEPNLAVSSIYHRTCTEKERVYDITVEDAQSFVIGTGVVHNCHRISQENSVNIYYFLAENTIDEKVHKLIEKKRKVTHKVNAGKKLEKDELKEIEKESDITKGLIKELLENN